MNTHMKISRIVRPVTVAVIVVFYLLGMMLRSSLTDSGLAAYDAQIKKADVSVSVSEEGHVVKVEGIQASGQPASPCSATLIFQTSPAK